MRPLAIITLALAAAACGASPNTPSAGQSSNGSDPGFKFASCMRHHGVANFPDPQVTTTPGGGGGSVKQVVPAADANAPAFKGAQKACAGILNTAGTRERGPRPSKLAFLAFARCLRSRGVSNFPDPNGQGQLTGSMIAAAGIDFRAPSFKAAAYACAGVTHGAITPAAVTQAINHLSQGGS